MLKRLSLSDSLLVKRITGATTVLLFLLPLLYMPGHSSYASARYFIFGTVVLALFVATVAVWSRVPHILQTLRTSWIKLASLVFLVVFLVVSVASTDPATSWYSSFQRTDGMFAILFLTLFGLVIYTLVSIGGSKTRDRFVQASVLGAFALSLLLVLSPDGLDLIIKSAHGGATTGNSSVAGSYMVWNIFFALFVWSRSSTTNQKIRWGIVVAVLCLSPLFANWYLISGSATYTSLTDIIGSARGALVGVLYGVIVGVGVWFVMSTEPIRKWIGRVFLGIVVVSTIAGGVLLLKDGTKLNRLFAAAASESRFIFWDIAMKGFKERPLVGWGPGTFETPYHLYFNPAIFNPGNPGEVLVDRTHNIFFETLVSGGVILMVGLLYLLSSLVISIVRYGKRHLSAFETACLVGGVAAWLLQAQFIFESLLSLAMLYLVFGIVTSKEHEGPVSFDKDTNWPVWAAGVGALGVFVIAIVLPFQKDRALARAYTTKLPARIELWQKTQGISPMGDGYDSVLVYDRVYDAYRKQIQTIRDGDSRKREIALQEIDAVSQQLEYLIDRRPNDYSLLITASRMNLLRMLISSEATDPYLTKARHFAQRAIDISPTDPQIILLHRQLNKTTD